MLVGTDVRAVIKVLAVENKSKGTLVTCSTNVYLENNKMLAVEGVASVLVPKM